MVRRWASFHHDMRRMSGKWWQRVLGELLGEDTRRYRVVRRFGRPILQFFRRLRTRQADEPVKATAQFATAPLKTAESHIFPYNYSPKTSIRFINLASFKVPTDDVTTVEVDERLSASVAIESGQRRARRCDHHLALPVRRHPQRGGTRDDAARAVQSRGRRRRRSSPTRSVRTSSRRSSSSRPCRRTRCSVTTSSVGRRCCA